MRTRSIWRSRICRSRSRGIRELVWQELVEAVAVENKFATAIALSKRVMLVHGVQAAYLNLLYTAVIIKMTNTVMIATVIIRFVAILVYC